MTKLSENQVKKLVNYCLQTETELKTNLKKELIAMKRPVINKDGFLYSKGSHPVLIIAHLDTVYKTPPVQIYMDDTDEKSPDGDLWSHEGIGGDDRCGCFIIMEIIKELDCHVLFCEQEESGGKGAHKFNASGIVPDIQFMVEFDRKNGNDAVFYACDNEDFNKFVESFGFKKTFGSYSDISTIAPHLKIAAVNLSSGYYNQHQAEEEYIRLHEVYDVIQKAIPLLKDISTKYEYVTKVYAGAGRTGYGSYYGYNAYDGYDDDYEWVTNANGFKTYKKKAKQQPELLGVSTAHASTARCDWCDRHYGKQFVIELKGETFCKHCIKTDAKLKEYLGCYYNWINDDIGSLYNDSLDDGEDTETYGITPRMCTLDADARCIGCDGCVADKKKDITGDASESGESSLASSDKGENCEYFTLCGGDPKWCDHCSSFVDVNSPIVSNKSLAG
jgi:hypothetical protein